MLTTRLLPVPLFATGSRLTDPPDAAVFWWTCPGCGQTITDRGPVTGGHPQDAEQGHGEGCAQLATAVAAWDADWTQDS